jgi:hypothetical protein
MCPDCRWKPASVEAPARLSELIDHVKEFHGMGEPRIEVRDISLADSYQKSDVAIFGNDSYWRWLDGFRKSA